jgi:hypothetical protein
VAAPATYNRNPLDSKASHRLSSRSSLLDSVSSNSSNHCSNNTLATLPVDFSLRRLDTLFSNSSSSTKASSNRSRPATNLLLFRNSSSRSRPDTQASSINNSKMAGSNRLSRRFLNPQA